MGRILFIAFLGIFLVAGAHAQTTPSAVKKDSSIYEPKAYGQPQPNLDSANDLTFAVKLVSGTPKKLNVEMVSPKSGYAEVSLLNSRGDQVLILHKGKVQSGVNTFHIDSTKVRPGLYYVVSKYEGGVQVADKITVTK